MSKDYSREKFSCSLSANAFPKEVAVTGKHHPSKFRRAVEEDRVFGSVVPIVLRPKHIHTIDLQLPRDGARHVHIHVKPNHQFFQTPPANESCRMWMTRVGVFKLRFFRYALIAAGLLMGWAPAGLAATDADPPSARDVIDREMKDALVILRDAKLTQSQKRQKITELADAHTDFQTLARLTLGRYWRDLSADQRAAFVKEFKKHLSSTYGNLLNGYTDEDVKVSGDHREQNGDWTVQLSVIGTINGTRLELAKVDCRLRHKSEWKLIDVIVEGVSVVAIFRAQFQEIMANGGFDHLMQLLREKVDQQDVTGPQTKESH